MTEENAVPQTTDQPADITPIHDDLATSGVTVPPQKPHEDEAPITGDNLTQAQGNLVQATEDGWNVGKANGADQQLFAPFAGLTNVPTPPTPFSGGLFTARDANAKAADYISLSVQQGQINSLARDVEAIKAKLADHGITIPSTVEDSDTNQEAKG